MNQEEEAYKIKYRNLYAKLKAEEKEHDRLVLRLTKLNAGIRRVKVEKAFLCEQAVKYHRETSVESMGPAIDTEMKERQPTEP